MSFSLATVTSPDFLPGSLVLFQSFLKANPWFDGDLVVIHDRLNPFHQSKFDRFGRRVVFRQVSGELSKALNHLADAIPGLADRLERFYSIEAFRPAGYDKVLYCDSDVLVRSSVDYLFRHPHFLAVTPDGPTQRGHCRNRTTFREMPNAAHNAMNNTFNAGVMALGAEILDEDTYQDILSMVHPEQWRGVETPHTDQIIYNRLFEGKQRMIDSRYNYLLADSGKQDTVFSIKDLEAAKLVHFNGRIKPWKPEHYATGVERDLVLKTGMNWWHQTHAEVVS